MTAAGDPLAQPLAHPLPDATPVLTVRRGPRTVGQVTRDADGQLAFAYAEAWRADPRAHALSLSLPLSDAVHGHAAIANHLAGLLPDEPLVRARWAHRFRVAEGDDAGLLAHAGGECAGGAAFAAPGARPARAQPARPLSAADLGARLQALRGDHAAWRADGDPGWTTLAGSRPKTALALERGRWSVPGAGGASTHILKPATGAVDGEAENQHLCLALARALGIAAARSSVQRFGGETALVVERFDRVAEGGTVLRVHQEDMVQALGLPPAQRSQRDGGPGAAAIAGLLRAHSSRPAEDVAAFVDALAFNWLIGGADGHARNHAVLLGGAGRVRLAPLYDLASALPYGDPDGRKVRLAMKIGGEYRLRDIGPKQWRKLAANLELDGDALIARLSALAERMPATVARVRDRALAEGLRHPILDSLAGLIAGRAAKCRVMLAG